MSEQWLQDTYPAVPPDAKFRQDLQRALEQSHRQQAAQRKLGTRHDERRQLPLRQATGIFLMLLALVLIARWFVDHEWSS
jgi:hypothetical protein